MSRIVVDEQALRRNRAFNDRRALEVDAEAIRARVGSTSSAIDGISMPRSLSSSARAWFVNSAKPSGGTADASSLLIQTTMAASDAGGPASFAAS